MGDHGWWGQCCAGEPDYDGGEWYGDGVDVDVGNGSFGYDVGEYVGGDGVGYVVDGCVLGYVCGGCAGVDCGCGWVGSDCYGWYGCWVAVDGDGV